MAEHMGSSKVHSAAPSFQMAQAWSGAPDVHEAAQEAVSAVLDGLTGVKPQFVTLFTTGGLHDGADIYKAVKKALPEGVKLWGLNSDLYGVIDPQGIKPGISLVGFADERMVAGVAAQEFNWEDQAGYREVGRALGQKILADAGKTADEPPTLLLFAGTYMIADTEIYNGIQEVLGNVPIFGGNAGRHHGEHPTPDDGYVLTTDGVHVSSIGVAGLWLANNVGMAYGYSNIEHHEHKGVVTKADPVKRLVYEIDGRPAADVYNEWTGGLITEVIKAGGGPIPMDVIGSHELKKPVAPGSPDYVAVGVAQVLPDKSLFVILEGIAEGTEVTLLTLGSEEDVVNRTSIIATVARNRGNIKRDDVAGALIVYCMALQGTARAAGYKIDDAFPTLSLIIGNVPFAGFLAAGEIGYSPHFGENGNRLMATSNVLLVFGKK